MVLEPSAQPGTPGLQNVQKKNMANSDQSPSKVTALRCRVADADASRLDQFSNLKSLVVEADGLTHLCLRAHPELEELEVLGDECVKTVDVGGCPNLRRLSCHTERLLMTTCTQLRDVDLRGDDLRFMLPPPSLSLDRARTTWQTAHMLIVNAVKVADGEVECMFCGRTSCYTLACDHTVCIPCFERRIDGGTCERCGERMLRW